jgi:uncharacterized membrane protein
VDENLLVWLTFIGVSMILVGLFLVIIAHFGKKSEAQEKDEYPKFRLYDGGESLDNSEGYFPRR